MSLAFRCRSVHSDPQVAPSLQQAKPATKGYMNACRVPARRPLGLWLADPATQPAALWTERELQQDKMDAEQQIISEKESLVEAGPSYKNRSRFGSRLSAFAL